MGSVSELEREAFQERAGGLLCFMQKIKREEILMLSEDESELYQRLFTYVQQRHPSGFASLPATEAQLDRTEELLDLSLPPLLRALYTQIANGGFGPGGSPSEYISGALGGFHHETIDRLLRDQQLLLKQGFSFVNIEDIEAQQGDARILLFEQGVFPHNMFCLLKDSNFEIYIQCQTGRIYLATDDYDAVVHPGERFEGWIWFRLRNSLADWLVSWLHDETTSNWLVELERLLYASEQANGKRSHRSLSEEEEAEDGIDLSLPDDLPFQ